MKKIIPYLTLLFLTSCSDNTSQNTQPNKNRTDQIKPIVSEKNINLKPLGNPCQLSGDLVSKILKWEGGSEGLQNAINNKNRKGCNYGSNTGQLQVSFERYEQRYIDKKFLENSFIKQLENPSSKITSQKINENIGDQVIFITGKNGPNNMYQLKWRNGNHTQKSVVFNSYSDIDTKPILQQLIMLANALEN